MWLTLPECLPFLPLCAALNACSLPRLRSLLPGAGTSGNPPRVRLSKYTPIKLSDTADKLTPYRTSVGNDMLASRRLQQEAEQVWGGASNGVCVKGQRGEEEAERSGISWEEEGGRVEERGERGLRQGGGGKEARRRCRIYPRMYPRISAYISTYIRVYLHISAYISAYIST